MTDPNALAGRIVLIVEDDPLLAMLLDDVLRGIGCAVAGRASKLEDALVKARSLPVDAAVLDVDLNGKQTFPVAEALMARGIPVVFTTGYDAKTLPSLFDGVPVLRKPFSECELQQALLAALSARA